ncbi:MAG: TIGR00341 family protein [Flavobacteriales bacterium]|nr:TIGR00341 family protein [Flavobacteriales bacterium]
MESKPESTDNSGNINDAARNLLKSVSSFLIGLLSIAQDVDKSEAEANIRSDVEFKGFNIWILFCSVLICSIGLNLNSTAVVIGAMLISPLMGPLVGTGFSVGTFDRDLLIKSLKNLSNALIISLLASYIFFSLAPTSHDQSELLARTRPNLLDLFVALFGGFAGILAVTRRIKTNVIPGVAIATALMPPLCTAGYALAAANWTFFLGAFYLFFINSVMIAFSALIVVWYLRFPKATYINQRTRRLVRIGIIIFIGIVAVPSAWMYARALRETIFMNRANGFIDQQITVDGRKIFDPELIYGRDSSYIRLFVYGKPFTDQQIDSFRQILSNYGIFRTDLQIENMGSIDESRSQVRMKELEISQKQQVLSDIQLQLMKRTEEVDFLSERLKQVEGKLIDSDQLNKEALVQYPELDRITYNWELQSDDSISAIPTFILYFKTGTRIRERSMTRDRVNEWLKVKYEEKFDSIQVFTIGD